MSVEYKRDSFLLLSSRSEVRIVDRDRRPRSGNTPSDANFSSFSELGMVAVSSKSCDNDIALK